MEARDQQSAEETAQCSVDTAGAKEQYSAVWTLWALREAIIYLYKALSVSLSVSHVFGLIKFDVHPICASTQLVRPPNLCVHPICASTQFVRPPNLLSLIHI